MHITTDAIILRERQIEDYDSILTMLTRERGVITAYARAARKPRSALRVSAELLSYSDFVLFSNKERYSVDKASMSRLFMGIRGDVVKLSLACYFCQLTAEVAPHEESAGEYLRLLLNCLHLLDRDRRSCGFVKPVYELRLLTMAGFMPNLIGCAGCGVFEAPSIFFLPHSSALLCGGCIENATKQEARLPLEAGVLAAMRHILYAESEKLFGFTLSEAGLEQLGEVTQQYLVHQLEKRFETLDFYRSVC